MKSELYCHITEEAEALRIALANRKENMAALGRKYAGVKRIFVVGSGTSCHAGLSMKREMEKLAGCEVTALFPSAFREMVNLPAEGALCLGVSQSGRSAVTVKALERCRELGYFTCAVSSNKPSPLADAAEDYIPLEVGLEASATTKGYVASMLTLLLLALEIGLANGHATAAQEAEIVSDMEGHIARLPGLIEACEAWVTENREELLQAERMSVLGYEANYGTAMEGALKLLEAVRVMVAGYDFEEWLHGGYNALSEKSYLFLCASPSRGDYRQRLDKVVEVIRPYTPHIYVIGGQGPDRRTCRADFSGKEWLAPYEYILPFQMMIALLPEMKGINADRVLIPTFHAAVGSKVFNT